MEKYIPVLKRTQLFAGVGDEEIGAMLGCLQAKFCTCERGEYVFRQGEHLDRIAVLVEGALHIQREDYWGNRAIVHQIGPGEMFGESYAVPGSGALVHDVVAVEDSAVVLFHAGRVLTVCSSACQFHSLVVRNLFFALSERNRKLMGKLGHMSQRSTREKLLSYLSEEARCQNSAAFSIPFNRQQLADFLSVDRSAMSKELCRLRDEGLLRFEKNRFTLL